MAVTLIRNFPEPTELPESAIASTSGVTLPPWQFLVFYILGAVFSMCIAVFFCSLYRFLKATGRIPSRQNAQGICKECKPRKIEDYLLEME